MNQYCMMCMAGASCTVILFVMFLLSLHTGFIQYP